MATRYVSSEIVVILIFVFGGVVLFSKTFNYVPTQFRVIIGIMIVLYGAFRFASMFNKIKNDDES